MYFNPLPRKEGDAVVADWFYKLYIISIHSLVKRETFLHIIFNVQLVSNFNPLPRKEGDGESELVIMLYIKFQSTPS